MSTSKIEWTEKTWNPLTGCNKISPGCKHCYAERMAKRLKAMGQANYRNGFELTLQPHTLEHPYQWKKPTTVFVNSMSDLFHKDVPLDYIQRVFHTMNSTPMHRYQVLTKRADRLLELSSRLNWTDNIWMGVSIENQDYAYRGDALRQTSAKVKFFSIEPLIGEIHQLDLTNIDWVIVGGESGPGARPMNPKWVESIHAQCKEQDVAFFFKQWGGVNKKKTGRTFLGQTWNEMPAIQQSYQHANPMTEQLLSTS